MSKRRLKAVDLVVVGGGIVGASAAALLAEAGLAVTLIEEHALAAGASGRNSGAVQHPFHPLLGRLHTRSLEMYRELAAADEAFTLPTDPAGLLMVSPDGDLLAARAAHLARLAPELAPRLLDPSAVHASEPALREGLWALALNTGYPVVPAAATLAYARRAQRAGAQIVIGASGKPLISNGRVVGTRLDTGETIDCPQVLVAAGPRAVALIPGWASTLPVVASWGLVVSTRMEDPPKAILEEVGIDSTGSVEPMAFSLVTADGASAVGSTFLPEPPDPERVVPLVLERAARFVPALGGAGIVSVRVCARPLSVDGLPFVGPVDGVSGLFVCVGHGPWGISTGPASAELVGALMLGGSGVPDDVAGGLLPDRGAVQT